MATKLRGNQCVKCEKTHEECRNTRCSKADISAYVCHIFGIPSRSKPRKKV